MENAFDQTMLRAARGLGQDPLGGAASASTDQGNTLFSGGAEGGTSTSSLLGPDGSDPTYSGDPLGSGGTSGGGSLGPASSGSGTSASSVGSSLSNALSSLTSGSNTSLLIGAGVLVLGIAGVAYYAHEHKTGGSRRSSFSGHRSAARRRR